MGKVVERSPLTTVMRASPVHRMGPSPPLQFNQHALWQQPEWHHAISTTPRIDTTPTALLPVQLCSAWCLVC